MVGLLVGAWGRNLAVIGFRGFGSPCGRLWIVGGEAGACDLVESFRVGLGVDGFSEWSRGGAWGGGDGGVDGGPCLEIAGRLDFIGAAVDA